MNHRNHSLYNAWYREQELFYDTFPRWMHDPLEEKKVFLREVPGRVYDMLTEGNYAMPFRWTLQRKARLAMLIIASKLNVTEAAEALDIPAKEIRHWWYVFSAYGLNGLKARNTKHYRMTI